MKTATITETKNNLSALLDRVRKGESILILDRGRPVARLESVLVGPDVDDGGRLVRLERQGLVRRARRETPTRLVQEAPPRAAKGASVLAALLDERRDGR